MVVGTYKVNNTYPAADAGLKIGDLIVAVNEKKIGTINQMIATINTTVKNNIVLINYIRDDKSYSTTLKLYKDNNIHIYRHQRHPKNIRVN